MHKKISLLASLAFLALVSCEKEKKVTPVTPNSTPEVVPILNNNSGFKQSLDIVVKLTEMNTGSQGALGLYDFTIDHQNHLNICYYDEWQSQQSKIKTLFRKSFDFATGKDLDVTYTSDPYAYDGFKQGIMQYMPYSDKLALFFYSDAGSGNYARAGFSGDMSGDLPFGQGWQGNYSGGFGFYNAFAEQKTNGGKFYLSVLMLPNSPVLSSYEYKTPTMDGLLALGYADYNSHFIANFPEPRYQAGQGQSVNISVCADSVIAYKINNVLSPSKIYTKTGHIAASGFSLTDDYTIARRYNTDGTILSMLVQDKTTRKVWTYTYNFTTDQLKSGLTNVLLPYADIGSDMDLDEEGNVYYSGAAGNGTNTSGVTIYKQTATASTTIGADNFLKFGEIVRLKYINGKVHLAVTGNITGYKAWAQLTVLTQQ
ncbi:MAG: hypothetical protein EOP54_11855 [Sphingobacteriales bacterium]|nr:MAG: hypothetical protein EOP54_11855 [Sphingobacteriales bacterium]